MIRVRVYGKPLVVCGRRREGASPRGTTLLGGSVCGGAVLLARWTKASMSYTVPVGWRKSFSRGTHGVCRGTWVVHFTGDSSYAPML